jgi:flagellar biosynthesis/type III secretory pathway protein FliH
MILNKDYNKGFNDGLKSGHKAGLEEGLAEGMVAAKRAVAEDFVNRLQRLRNEKGIGPKTWEKILDCLDISKDSEQELDSEET